MAILCRVCGTRNPDDASFCSNCESFLEWEGERVPDESDGVSHEEARTEPEATQGAEVTASPSGHAPQADSAHHTADVVDAASAETTATSAEPPIPRPEARRPVAPSPPPRRPTAAAERATEARAAPPSTTRPRRDPVKPGDLVCGACETGNDPRRRFCRRCGNSLATAAIAIRPPWYRSIFSRGDRAMAAGARPRGMGRAEGSRSILFSLILLLIVGGLAGGAAAYLLVPEVQSRVNGAVGELRRTLLPSYEEVHPQASGEGLPGHPGSHVTDGRISTYWAADPANGPPALVIHFQEPTDLGKLVALNGAEEFLAYRRPRTIELRFNSGAAQRLELGDMIDEQVFDLDARSVAEVTLVVIDWYEAVGDAPMTSVAVRELEFRARR